MLVVEHEAQCPPAWLGDWLVAAGAELVVCRPYDGDDLPADLSGVDALVVLGGAMGAYDDGDFPWLSGVQHLFRRAVADGTPALGVCLGHQLAAVALGGTVGRNPRGQQMGLLPVGWLPAAEHDPVLGRVPRGVRAVQWNRDVVRELPPGAQLLAATTYGEVQAVRYAPRVWGVQWHPELGAHVLARWADNDRDRARERGIDVDEYVARVDAASEELQGWRSLATAFVEVAALAPAAST